MSLNQPKVSNDVALFSHKYLTIFYYVFKQIFNLFPVKLNLSVVNGSLSKEKFTINTTSICLFSALLYISLSSTHLILRIYLSTSFSRYNFTANNVKSNLQTLMCLLMKKEVTNISIPMIRQAARKSNWHDPRMPLLLCLSI